MSAIDELVVNNASAATPAGAGEPRDGAPSRRVAIVACMDARLDVFRALGLRPGEAHVIRNAGGVVTDDVIRSLAISQRKLGTKEVMLIHHTDCGMLKLADEEFRSELERSAGAPPPFAIGAFDDLEGSVRKSVQRVRESPFLPHREQVRGFVYDVAEHRLREVTP